MQPNYIKDLLGLKDILIKKIVHADNHVEFYIETKPKPHICLCCNKETMLIHDYRTQVIKDLPFQLKHCYLVLRKRRYCYTCGKRFFESYSFLPRYFQRTLRLTHKVADLLRETCSLKSVAQKVNLSPFTVTRILERIHYSCSALKEAIATDEFKGNAKTGKYQCILVNPKQGSVMDILPNRQQHELIQYFKNIPR